MCKLDHESFYQLFVTCSFANVVRDTFASCFSLSINWKEPFFLENLNILTSKANHLLYLPIFYIWCIWKAHNLCIFDDQEQLVGTISYRILNIFYAYPFVRTMVTHRDIGPVPDIIYPSGYFDGAAITNIGGVGFVLIISSSHFFHAKMGQSKSTNTRAELLAPWSLMSFAVSIGIPTLSVFGDSQVIINGANSMACLAMMDLDH